jgi:hypothetical protein
MHVDLAALRNSHPRRTATFGSRGVLIWQTLKQVTFISHRQLRRKSLVEGNHIHTTIAKFCAQNAQNIHTL